MTRAPRVHVHEAQPKLRLLDLFSGIGGFSLGLERSGYFETVAFCEIEPFPRRVLKKHWPHVPCYEDVCTLTAGRLTADGIAVDAICGGFPCQDISFAGKGAGLEGERSGLWSEYWRLVGEIRPSVVVVENVSALLGRGVNRVLGDLAALGYDAEWHCIPASALGAPHRRDRLWIVAYPNASEWGTVGEARQRLAWSECLREWQESAGGLEPSSEALADANGEWELQPQGRVCDFGRRASDGGQDVPNANDEGLGRGQRFQSGREGKGHVAYSGRDNAQGVITAGAYEARRSFTRERPIGSRCDGLGWWSVEPDVGRMAHGVPSRVDRLKGLGNAVVPQIPELIGTAIGRAMFGSRP